MHICISELKNNQDKYTMVFIGITKVFSLKDENQYETIGNFWDETAKLYGMENLQGLGYKWKDGKIFYAIGLKNGIIEQADFQIELPDNDWLIINGKTNDLKNIYDEIYKNGPLKYEIETFDENGNCRIKYYR